MPQLRIQRLIAERSEISKKVLICYLFRLHFVFKNILVLSVSLHIWSVSTNAETTGAE